MKRKLKSATFVLPESLAGSQVWRDVRSSFPVAGDQRSTFHRAYYDTFDWRLYRSGYSLSREERRYELRRLDDDTVLTTAVAAGECRFWRDFPKGMLRYVLEYRLGERALLGLVTLKIDRRVTNVLNREKPVVCVHADDITLLNGHSTPEHVRAVTLRSMSKGYDEAKAIRHRLIDQGLAPDARPWLDVVLERVGRQPCDYSPKLELRFEHGTPARDAAVAIFTQLLATMERNQHGIRNDIDIEFLHDFRVAVRRTRAGLAQIKDVFPPDATARFKDDFAQLGRLTNRLRDLDVYFLRRKDYEAMLPAPLQPAVQPMFDDLAVERAAELRRLVEAMGSEAYRQRLVLWRAFLEDGSGEAGSNASVPIGALARRLIRKQHRRIVRMAMAMHASSGDSEIHALRMEMKKLRYLLEFFESVFRPKLVARLIKRLKEWQDLLGEYNDLSVERAELGRQLERIDPATDTAKAIGRLIETLGLRRQAARDGFAGAFTRLGAKTSVRMYDKLIDP